MGSTSTRSIGHRRLKHVVSLFTRLGQRGVRGQFLSAEHQPKQRRIINGEDYVADAARIQARNRIGFFSHPREHLRPELRKTLRRDRVEQSLFVGEVMIRSGWRNPYSAGDLAERQIRQSILFQDPPRGPNQGVAQIAVMVGWDAVSSLFLRHSNMIVRNDRAFH